MAHSTKYSPPPRSRAHCRAPSPASQLVEFWTDDLSPPTLSPPGYLPTGPRSGPRQASAVSRTPTSSQSSRSPRDVLDADWFEPQPPQSQTQDIPLVRVEGAPGAQIPLSSSALQAQTRNMGAVALQYDPGFNMGTKSSYTWPVPEHMGGLTAHDLGHYSSDASITPPTLSRSVTGSPPRSVHGLSADQRELKRQRDQARRETKLHVRAQRPGSASSSLYSPTPSMVDLHLSTGASSLPMYTTAPSSHSQTNQLILMVEPPTSSYLSPSFSPPLPPDQSQAGMYQTPYSAQSYMNYPNYASTSGSGMASQFGLAMYPAQQVMSDPGPDAGTVRVVQSRPKPQCWEHGCNGRQFSTFSNLLRHQREKSGQAAKAVCPNCGAQFTRTTARNGHLLHDKCKSKGSGGS